MFHRVSPQSENTASQSNSTSEPQSAQGGAQAQVRPLQERAQPSQSVSQNQRKDTSPMNSDSPENKPATTGGYQPTPAASQTSRMDIPGARTAAPQRPANSPYPGSQPSQASAYSPQPSASEAAKSANKKLQIGQGITLSGEIEDCEYLYVEGTVEAALKGASVLEIAESGAFYGTVEIDEATIAGRFEGDLTVKGRLTIEATGSITGSIAYKELAVEAGASLDGKVTPLNAKGEAARSTEGNSPRGKAKRPADKQAVAQNDHELPFSDTMAVRAAE